MPESANSNCQDIQRRTVGPTCGSFDTKVFPGMPPLVLIQWQLPEYSDIGTVRSFNFDLLFTGITRARIRFKATFG